MIRSARGVDCRDGGSAAVLVAGACAAVLVLGMATAVVATAAYGSARARSAADLGALAGASANIDALVGRTGPDPCGAAATVVALNGASLVSCRIDGSVNVSVVVAVPLTGSGGWASLPDARASARAGPEPPGHDEGTVPRGNHSSGAFVLVP